MRTIYILFFLILSSISGAFAQQQAFNCERGKGLTAKESGKIVKQVQKNYSAMQGLKASFTQSGYLAALEVSEISSGQMWFKKPGKMKWHYFEPEEQVFIVRDNTFWLYQINERQVLISTLSEVFISDLPVSFMLGMGDLSRDFNVLESCSNPEGIVLKLQPNKKSDSGEASLQTFSLLVHRTKYYPIGALVVDIGGNITAIVLSEIKLNPTHKEDTFKDDFPSGIDIDDRRNASPQIK